MTTLLPEELARFWWFSQERYQIKLRREAGASQPWTQDPHLQERHFCNVFRSDDRASQEIARLARVIGRYGAALIGRLINRPETISEIRQTGDIRGAVARYGINTNAYRINTPRGLNQILGIYEMIELGWQVRDGVLAQMDVPAALHVLGQVPCLGGFVGYQIILDLVEFNSFEPGFRDDWSYPGVGAQRGALTLLGRRAETYVRDVEHWKSRRRGSPVAMVEATYEVIQELLRQSRDPGCWPWPERPWSIHEAEGQLCEYDKYVRCLSGSMGGRRFRPQVDKEKRAA